MIALDHDPFTAGQTVRFDDNAVQFIEKGLDSGEG